MLKLKNPNGYNEAISIYREIIGAFTFYEYIKQYCTFVTIENVAKEMWWMLTEVFILVLCCD